MYKMILFMMCWVSVYSPWPVFKPLTPGAAVEAPAFDSSIDCALLQYFEESIKDPMQKIVSAKQVLDKVHAVNLDQRNRRIPPLTNAEELKLSQDQLDAWYAIYQASFPLRYIMPDLMSLSACSTLFQSIVVLAQERAVVIPIDAAASVTKSGLLKSSLAEIRANTEQYLCTVREQLQTVSWQVCQSCINILEDSVRNDQEKVTEAMERLIQAFCNRCKILNEIMKYKQVAYFKMSDTYAGIISALAGLYPDRAEYNAATEPLKSELAKYHY